MKLQNRVRVVVPVLMWPEAGMKIEEARRTLAAADETGEPVDLPLPILPKLTIDDVPDGAFFQVGTQKGGVLRLAWSGRILRSGKTLYAEAEHTFTRKYWYAPLGLEQYLDLVRRAV